jgi:FkbH-like protein
MRAICSRNDRVQAERLLRALGLWDYFIFPSIDWSPRLPRIRALIEGLRLRPAAVMLIDHDKAHLAAAKAALPELQVASPDFLPALLADERFAGREDPDMSRLRQYKSMERQTGGIVTATGDAGEDEAFLRASNIVVTIDTDVAAHIDRAVALVNSVNPLNLTKNYLPSHLPSARQNLLAAIDKSETRAGLIRVSDRYGDYGYCGFFLIEGAPPVARLRHLSLSRRIFGMGIERWLYDWLGRPGLGDAGEVPAQLVSAEPPDWIGTGNAIPLSGLAHVPQIVIRGGYGFDAIADQCRLNSGDVTLETNRNEWHVTLNHDTTTNLTLTLRDHSPEALTELRRIGFRPPDLVSRLWTIAPGGIAIFGGWGDLRGQRYRFKPLNMDLSFQISPLSDDFDAVTEQDILDFGAAKGLIPETIEHVRKFVGYIAQVYERLPLMAEPERLRVNLHAIFSAFPSSATLFMLLPPTIAARPGPGRSYEDAAVSDYRAIAREVAAGYAHVELIDVDDYVADGMGAPHAIDGSDREIYARLYQAVMERSAQRLSLAKVAA